MGLFQSTPRRRSRQQVKSLKGAFHLLSTKIEKRLPWISLARNGTAVLLLVSTIFLLTAVSRSLWPPGGTAAGVVLILAFLLHLTSSILREHLINRTISLLEAFHEAVPVYMDTSSMPKVKGDGWLTYTWLLLLEVASILICFLFKEAEFVTEVFFAFILMGPSAGFLVWKIVRGMNDYEWVSTCRTCAGKLETLLNVSAGNEEEV